MENAKRDGEKGGEEGGLGFIQLLYPSSSFLHIYVVCTISRANEKNIDARL